MKTPEFKSEDWKTLESAYVGLFHLNKELNGVLNERIFSALKEVEGKLSLVLKPYQEEEEKSLDKKIKGFYELQEQHGFKTVWSMYDEVSLEEMKSGAKFPRQIKKIVYEKKSWGVNEKMEVKTPELSWIDVWSVCDALIKESGDLSHIFIEDLVEKDEGVFSLITGS